ARRGQSVRARESSRQLPGSRPAGVQLGRHTATRSRTAQRASAPAVVTRASRLAGVARVGSRTEHFRTWTQAIARRRGRKVAMVALARRLARTLFAMWRDQTDYQLERVRTRRTTRDTAGTIDASTSASGVVFR